MFQGPKRRPNDLKIYEHHFLEGTRPGSERSKQGRPEGPDEWAHTAQVPGHVGPPLLALGAPFVRFLRPQVLFLPNIDARKFAGDLDVVWVPETLKERNRVFCLRRVNSIKIGNMSNIPKIIIKQ